MGLFRQLRSVFHWSRTSYILLSGFILILFLIGYVWWPLLDEYLSYFNDEISIWRQLDWLLIGNFLVMSLLIMLNADLKRDIPYLLIALAGGYIIEAWGTLSGLWTYYTFETPPLWIIPAWPIAALSVKRITTFLRSLTNKFSISFFNILYWPIFGAFLIYLLIYVWPKLSHPLTIFSVIVCFGLVMTSQDKRSDLLFFIAGSLLGYFLERWGTTRLCWTYYTYGQPPVFTVLAHGMASVAVWRVYCIYLTWISKVPWMEKFLPEQEKM